jgi:LacI family transcriptional regulator
MDFTVFPALGATPMLTSPNMRAGSRRSRTDAVSNGGGGLDEAPVKPTIRAVAERADVAISTVSRVVNGGRASEVIRRRVQRAIDDLGYTPSIAAQSLVLRRTGCIGLAVNRSTSPWFSQILSGVEQALAPSRKSVLLGSMMLKGHYDPAAVLAWIAEGRVDGLILVRYARRDRPLIEAAQRARLPLVLIAPDVSAPADFTVRCNNFEAGGLVAQHLAKLGHRRVAFAGGPKESFDTRQRLEGLREGLSEHGVSIDPEFIWFGLSYSRENGAEYARSFLQRSPAERPTAVVLGNDPMALGFMRIVLQQGVSVPGDVSVVGFDGTPDGEQFWPGLTTVLQPTQQMAISGCEALLERIDRRQQDSGSSIEFAVQMIERESTAAPRRA